LRCCPFFDLDVEVEIFFGMTIERLQNRFPTSYSYRKEAAKVLMHVSSREDSRNAVIALPPSGLRDALWAVVKKTPSTTVVLEDTPVNILTRIRFCDIDSKLIERVLTESEKKLYMKEIQKDITFFRSSFKRANMTVSIVGMDAEEAAAEVQRVLRDAFLMLP
jgi:shikimate kinase